MFESLCWIGVRTPNFVETVAFYRDVVGLDVLRESGKAVWFRLGDGTELHVYRQDDADHDFFGDGPVVGFAVANFADARTRMLEAGIAFIGEPQQEDGLAWNHFRGPDGNIYEIMGPG